MNHSYLRLIKILLLSGAMITSKVALSQSCITVAEDQNPAQCNYNYCYPDGPFEFSKGIYRLPYINGVTVHVTNDHFKHCPRGAVDMHGISGQSEYDVVAAADGWIRQIVDTNTVQCTCNAFTFCENNYVWLEHPNGEWTKYTHFKTGTVTSLGHYSGEWVTAGTVLGTEGTVGCSSGNHCHFEVAAILVPDTLFYDVIGGYIIPGLAKNLVPVFCGVPGNWAIAGSDYIVTSCSADCNASLPSSNTTYSSGVFKLFKDGNTLGNSHDLIFQSNSSGEFRAASEITLNVGFEALSNSVFEARIGDCDVSALKNAEESAGKSDHTPDNRVMGIFPNPASNLITVEWMQPEEAQVSISLTDIGNRVLAVMVPPGVIKAGLHQEALDVSFLSPGIYLVRLTGHDCTQVRKLVIQR